MYTWSKVVIGIIAALGAVQSDISSYHGDSTEDIEVSVLRPLKRAENALNRYVDGGNNKTEIQTALKEVKAALDAVRVIPDIDSDIEDRVTKIHIRLLVVDNLIKED